MPTCLSAPACPPAAAPFHLPAASSLTHPSAGRRRMRGLRTRQQQRRRRPRLPPSSQHQHRLRWLVGRRAVCLGALWWHVRVALCLPGAPLLLPSHDPDPSRVCPPSLTPGGRCRCRRRRRGRGAAAASGGAVLQLLLLGQAHFAVLQFLGCIGARHSEAIQIVLKGGAAPGADGKGRRRLRPRPTWPRFSHTHPALRSLAMRGPLSCACSSGLQNSMASNTMGKVTCTQGMWRRERMGASEHPT